MERANNERHLRVEFNRGTAMVTFAGYWIALVPARDLIEISKNRVVYWAPGNVNRTLTVNERVVKHQAVVDADGKHTIVVEVSKAKKGEA